MDVSEGSILPLYRQLKADIAHKVNTGEYAAGEKIPAELELCRVYGLSRSTVRQALLEMQEEGILVRARGKGTFVTSHGPTVHSMVKSHVAVIAPRPHVYLAPRILEGILSALTRSGCTTLVYDSMDTVAGNERAINEALTSGADGLLIQPPLDSAFSPKLRELYNSGFPLVTFDRPYRRLATDCVMADNVEGGYAATSHLISLGHERIAFIAESSMMTYSVQERYDGYLGALDAARMQVDESLVLAEMKEVGEVHVAAWYERLTSLLAGSNRPTAVFAVNDVVAMEVIRIARDLGLDVPGDVAVVGFDNSELSQHYSIPLTTVEQPLFAIGDRAASMLLERLGGSVDETRWVYLPTKLVVRRSCGSVDVPVGIELTRSVG